MSARRNCKNVSVCALSSALTLVSAENETAAFIVGEVERAAIERIGREAALSVSAVTRGSSRDQELQILRSWTEWYRGALDSTRDLELGGPSAGLLDRMAAAKAAVNSAFGRARRQIFEE